MEQLLRLIPTKPWPPIIRYSFTTLLVGLCFLIVIGIQGPAGFLGFFALFPAIFVSSILFDRGCGIYASLLSAVLLYLLIRPAQGFLLPSEFFLPLVIFVLMALLFAFMGEGLRIAWERAAAAEQTKDLLLQELGHRIKNNFAMAISLLSLQARSKTNPEVRVALEKAVSRLQAIASAHDYFHPSMRDGYIDMRHYLETLCGHLGDTLREVRPIAINVLSDELSLKSETAIPIGLIVNELVTNAFKHAFPGELGGTVKVTLKYGSPLALTVEDDGIGCPPTKQERIGSRLMRLLAQQIGASITWEQNNPGCRACVVVTIT